MDKNNILLVIAARGGSKGVKNKNIRPLCSMPLIAYSVIQAKKWGKAGKIICSTDSEQIASVAKEYGAEIPFMRPSELARDDSGKLEVLRHALITAEKTYNAEYSTVIDLDVTAPVRKEEDIEGCLELFKQKSVDCVFSVTPARKNPYFNMVEISLSGQAKLVKTGEKTFKRRQDAPKVYDMNASIYVYKREFLLGDDIENNFFRNAAAFIMDELSAFDIDNETDFQFIEYLVSKGLVTL